MSYFITNQKLNINQKSILEGDEAVHVLFSRRSKIGDKIFVQDLNNSRFECEITEATKKTVSLLPLKIATTPKESKLDLTLLQSLINEQALDIVIQKATELGVNTIIIFNSTHSPIQLKNDAISKKMNRWQKISLEAAKQSDRLIPAEIVFCPSLDKAITQFGKHQIFIAMPSTKKHNISETKLSKQKAGLLIGPEGGLSDQELDLISKFVNITEWRLGPRVMRSETAAISGIALLQAYFGDLA